MMKKVVLLLGSSLVITVLVTGAFAFQLYTIQVETLLKTKNLEYVEKEAKEISDDLGLELFIIKKDGIYVLQAGKFMNREQAEEMRKRLIKGYPDAFVTLWRGEKVIKTIGLVRNPKKEKKSQKPSIKKIRWNKLVRIKTEGREIWIWGSELWDFADLERLENPTRYVLHLFNTKPALEIDTIYSPTPDIEKTKIMYDYKDKKTNLIAYMKGDKPLVLKKEGRKLTLAPSEKLSQGGAEKVVEEKEGMEVARRPSVGGVKKVYKGKRVNLEFKNADIRDVIRLLAEISGMNFVIDPDVKGTVTVKLDNVPWDQALDIILRTNKLGKVEEEGIIRIATLKSLAEESRQQVTTKESLEKATPLVMEVIRLTYTDASEVEDLLDPLLSDDGDTDYIRRINAVVVTDHPERIKKIKDFIKLIDTPTPQVQIGARIVEVSSTHVKELGIQWGFLWRQSKTEMSFPYSFGIGGGVSSAPSAAQALTAMGATAGWSPGSFVPGFVVDLPAAVSTGAGGAIAASLLNRSETFGIDLRLSALEEEGVARTISNPKLITLDNQESEISQGYEIPFATVSEAGTQTQFKEAKLKLSVKPHVASNGEVMMDVEVSKDSPDFTHITPDGVPIQTRSIKTSVRLKNGDTLIIGGIYELTKSYTEHGVPGLMRVPLLSWLFKNESKNLEKRELLIFITPNVIEGSIAQSTK